MGRQRRRQVPEVVGDAGGSKGGFPRDRGLGWRQGHWTLERASTTGKSRRTEDRAAGPDQLSSSEKKEETTGSPEEVDAG